MSIEQKAFRYYNLYLTALSYLESTDLKRSLMKYNGKTKANFDTFKQSKYFSCCCAFAKKNIPEKEFLKLCLLCFHEKNGRFFIRDLFDSEVLDKYLILKNELINQKQMFKETLDKLLLDNTMHSLTTKGINFPLAVEFDYQGKVSIVFILLLNRATDFLHKFNEQNLDFATRLIWNEYYKRFIKWEEFLKDDLIIKPRNVYNMI